MYTRLRRNFERMQLCRKKPKNHSSQLILNLSNQALRKTNIKSMPLSLLPTHQMLKIQPPILLMSLLIPQKIVKYFKNVFEVFKGLKELLQITKLLECIKK